MAGRGGGPPSISTSYGTTSEVGKDLESSKSNQISTRLFAWEARLVDERDTGAAASQDQRGDAAGRTCAHN